MSTKGIEYSERSGNKFMTFGKDINELGRTECITYLKQKIKQCFNGYEWDPRLLDIVRSHAQTHHKIDELYVASEQLKEEKGFENFDYKFLYAKVMNKENILPTPLTVRLKN